MATVLLLNETHNIAKHGQLLVQLSSIVVGASLGLLTSVLIYIGLYWVPDSTAEDSTAEDSTADLHLTTTLRRSFSQNADSTAPDYIYIL